MAMLKCSLKYHVLAGPLKACAVVTVVLSWTECKDDYKFVLGWLTVRELGRPKGLSLVASSCEISIAIHVYSAHKNS